MSTYYLDQRHCLLILKVDATENAQITASAQRDSTAASAFQLMPIERRASKINCCDLERFPHPPLLIEREFDKRFLKFLGELEAINAFGVHEPACESESK